jgi:S-methylmethionine-dependent homocysteine/selenocysteine methylase
MLNVRLLDGGFGRALEEMGENIDAPLWSANAFFENSESIKRVHKDFIYAGAQIITSNTYAVTRYNFSKAQREHSIRDTLNLAYELAKGAISETGRDVILAASIPPLTESYRPDLVDEERLLKEYDELIECAVANDVDVLLAETLTSQKEAKALLRICQGWIRKCG